ncbi:MAG: hypothetical protein FJ144_12375 [Deltaproteobacteria bacterium]|nr:hypothetical protein [Deltaproteobacteria bacterium]
MKRPFVSKPSSVFSSSSISNGTWIRLSSKLESGNDATSGGSFTGTRATPSRKRTPRSCAIEMRAGLATTSRAWSFTCTTEKRPAGGCTPNASGPSRRTILSRGFGRGAGSLSAAPPSGGTASHASPAPKAATTATPPAKPRRTARRRDLFASFGATRPTSAALPEAREPR